MEDLCLVPKPKRVVMGNGYVCENAPIVRKIRESSVKESYRLLLSEDKILLEGDGAGVFYGEQTLKQLRIQFRNRLPCMEIQDEPRFGYRGYMLDSSRHFLPKEDVLRILDVLAMFKINRLHWHLIDDQGFRVEIPAFPKLTSVGAKRGRSYFGLVDELQGNDGYFTREDIREIVAYAEARWIEVIPEIEIPGHETAMIAAYPEIGCGNEPAQVETMGGIFDRLICAGKEESFIFVKRILDEFIELFPSKMIHIGGDEACKRRWRACPDCQRRMRSLGLKDENALQQWFVKRVQAYLKQKGRTAIVWNDSLRGEKLPEDFVVQMWMGDRELITEFARRGGKMIQSSTECHYLDYPYAVWDVAKILNTPVCPEYIDEKSIIGVECPLWMERITEPKRLFHLMLPRLPAMAECGWTATQARDNESFEKRYEPIAAYLETKGISGAPKAYWTIEPKLAKEELELHERIWYTPKNRVAFAKQEEMMTMERKIYGDERGN